MPGVAKFADTMITVITLIKTRFNSSIKVKRIRKSIKMQGLPVLFDLTKSANFLHKFDYFFGLSYARYDCANFQSWRIYVSSLW